MRGCYMEFLTKSNRELCTVQYLHTVCSTLSFTVLLLCPVRLEILRIISVVTRDGIPISYREFPCFLTFLSKALSHLQNWFLSSERVAVGNLYGRIVDNIVKFPVCSPVLNESGINTVASRS